MRLTFGACDSHFLALRKLENSRQVAVLVAHSLQAHALPQEARLAVVCPRGSTSLGSTFYSIAAGGGRADSATKGLVVVIEGLMAC